MRAKSKAIITCAITGSIHTPSMSPHLPVTPSDIAEQAVDAGKAGAAILHLHARDPKDGRGTVIAATAFGLRQVEAVRQARRVVYGAVLKDYSDAEKRELALVLERFTEALAEHMRTRA